LFARSNSSLFVAAAAAGTVPAAAGSSVTSRASAVTRDNSRLFLPTVNAALNGNFWNPIILRFIYHFLLKLYISSFRQGFLNTRPKADFTITAPEARGCSFFSLVSCGTKSFKGFNLQFATLGYGVLICNLPFLALLLLAFAYPLRV
jgi:hypothetical protein